MAAGPFTEYEQRFLLTEILKTSNVPIEALLNLIREQEFDPNWDDVGLPAGRNVKSCTAELSGLLFNLTGDSRFESAKGTPRGIKRTHAATGFYAAAAPAKKTREIKPKPASNGPENPATPAPAAGSGRKRGRPSNADIAQRAKEASERGEVYTGSTPATKRKSVGDLSVGDSPAPGSEPPVKRGRGRPPKSKSPVVTSEVRDNKPSDETEPVQGEVNEDGLPHDASTQETRETLEVVARASESLIPSPGAATTSTINKMLNIGQTAPQAPSPEHTKGLAC